MTRQRRIHIDGGVYYIIQEGGQSRRIFSAATDYRNFGERIPPLLERYRSRVHACSLLPNAFHLAVQISEIPVCRLMDDLKAAYAKHFNHIHGTRGPLLQARYRALLIDHRVYLPKLVHYIHHLPTLPHLRYLAPHYWTSHRTYLGNESTPWITTTVVMSMLASHRKRAEERYQEMMMYPPSTQMISCFESGSAHDGRVLGGPIFLRKLPQEVIPYRTVKTLDDLVRAVALNRGLSVPEVLSASRRREVVLARAIVTWHAIDQRIASLSTVARHFGRVPSTLLESMNHHRKLSGHLFERKELRYPVEPIGADLVGASEAELDETDLSDSLEDLSESDLTVQDRSKRLANMHSKKCNVH